MCVCVCMHVYICVSVCVCYVCFVICFDVSNLQAICERSAKLIIKMWAKWQHLKHVPAAWLPSATTQSSIMKNHWCHSARQLIQPVKQARVKVLSDISDLSGLPGCQLTLFYWRCVVTYFLFQKVLMFVIYFSYPPLTFKSFANGTPELEITDPNGISPL